MIKKVLTTTMLSATAFGMTVAHAATSGAYITGQLGYANTHMASKTDLTKFKHDGLQTDANNLANNGLAGRLAVGYQLNQNFAAELGYLQLNRKKVNAALAGQPISLSLQQNAIDLAGKAIVPVANNFNLYGKLGLAYVTTTTKGGSLVEANVHQHNWGPEAALGVSYNITPNISVDTSWTHIQPIGKNRPGTIDFAALGLGYYFG